MNRGVKRVVGLLLLASVTAAWWIYRSKSAEVISLTPEARQAMAAESAAQREQLIVRPAPRPRLPTAPEPEKNLYFGDLHVHTTLSFDSYLLGNRIGPDDAYRFADGQPVQTGAGEIMQINQPLDFVAITDHAESFGLFEACDAPGISQGVRDYCQQFEQPSMLSFLRFSAFGRSRPPVRPLEHCDGDAARCQRYADTTWQTIRARADAFNRPGEFTTLAAYEYSPMLPDNGKLHRNVIFRGDRLPLRATSAFDALTVLDLWRSLERDCTADCEFLTIPHNMNRAWGLAYSGRTIDGAPYTDDDWRLRARHEPLAEIFQIKGASECGVGAGAVDEECDFEQVVPICKDDDQVGCGGRHSYAREGLKKGLVLERALGFNPLRFGFVASTDTHNGNPGDTEEWDFRGMNGVYYSPARTRLGYLGEGRFKPLAKGPLANPGGLAAVWAPENTRDAIFEALRHRETYGTSGTRIRLRFFAGWNWAEGFELTPSMIPAAYEQGVPMGSVLRPAAHPQQRPAFVVWASKDPDGARLDRVQIVKAWLDGDTPREQVRDIACSDGRVPDPQTERCPDNGALVDLSNCAVDDQRGADELKVLWRDPDFQPGQSALYYARVLQNPSCRWSTYDAIRLGIRPREDVPLTVRERAWSSPIWIGSPGTP